MGTHSPLQIALLIVGGLAAVGVVVTYLRTRVTYAGYEEIAGDIRKLGRSMRGEIFRDGSDVVVSGDGTRIRRWCVFRTRRTRRG